MASVSDITTSVEIPYFSKIINSHHHDLEGIYIAFIDNIDKKEIKYSEFITFSQINILWPPKLETDETLKKTNKFKIYEKIMDEKIIDEKILEIQLNKYESRFFDIMATTIDDFSHKFNETYTLRIKNVSSSTLKFIKKNIITNNSTNVMNGGKPVSSYYQENEAFRSIIVYKYIDPVIRMCCEYLILLDKYFENTAKLQEFRTKGSNEIDETKFDELILHIRNKPGIKLPDAPREGVECVFGIGRIDCCSQILHKPDRNLRIMMELFNLGHYNHMKSQNNYKNTPFKTYETFSLPEPEELLIDEHTGNQDIILLVKIMQKAINAIISASGRVEGAPVTKQRNVVYPKIHLLEILDKHNTTWILRSERFHLSKSPCVHNGLKNLGKIDYFLKYLKIWLPGTQLEFAAVSWLHTIGHALDRLYCGHTTHEKLPHLQNSDTLVEIKSSFKVFMEMKSHSGEHHICGIIPCNHQNNNCVDLFFYICMNDFMSIENKLKVIHIYDTVLFNEIRNKAIEINGSNYFTLLDETTFADDITFERVSETSISDDEDEVEPGSAPISALVSSDLSGDTLTREIKLIIHCIKMHFDKRAQQNRKLQSCFPFFDVDVSYIYYEHSDDMEIKAECNIKKTGYSCLPTNFKKRDIQGFIREYPR